MDLWIRSQDRESILKPIDILLENPLNSGETGIRGYFSNNSYKMLGYYKTEQRALEVLDEIQSFLENNYISIDEMPSHSNSPYPGYYPTHTSTMYRKVFKMPKE